MTSNLILARALLKSSDAPNTNSASGVAMDPRLRSGVARREGRGMRKYLSLIHIYVFYTAGVTEHVHGRAALEAVAAVCEELYVARLGGDVAAHVDLSLIHI